MSAAINRSLTTVKTELEFLLESEVISEQLYNHVLSLLPTRYVKGMATRELDANTNINTNTNTTDNGASAEMKSAVPAVESVSVNPSSSSINEKRRPPAPPAASVNEEYVEAIYDFSPQQSDDLPLSTGDKVKIIERMSDAWWKGSCNGRVGVFPSNYVKVYNMESSSSSRQQPPPSYTPPVQQQQQPSAKYYEQQPYQQQQPYYQQLQPPSTVSLSSQQQPQQLQQAYQAPVQQVVQEPQQQGRHHSGASGAFKKFGSQLGNAAIFGAGATIGSDLVNSIF